MNILITGGAGYIGSVLTKSLLDAGHNVRVLDCLMYGGQSILPFLSSSRYAFQRGNVLNSRHCERAVKNIDTVIHLAAIVGEPACKQNANAGNVNDTGTQNIYIAAKKTGFSKFIFASTCSNYGQAKLATEETELKPIGIYARTKVDAEQWLKFQGDATILRFATAYGFSPRMRLDLIVQQFVVEALTGKLEIYNANAYRPLVDVRDIARAIKVILASCPHATAGQIYNVGGNNFTKWQLAEMIQDSAQTKIELREFDGRDYCVSFYKINQVGFGSWYSPRQFIPNLIDALQKGVFNNGKWSNTAH